MTICPLFFYFDGITDTVHLIKGQKACLEFSARSVRYKVTESYEAAQADAIAADLLTILKHEICGEVPTDFACSAVSELDDEQRDEIIFGSEIELNAHEFFVFSTGQRTPSQDWLDELPLPLHMAFESLTRLEPMKVLFPDAVHR